MPKQERKYVVTPGFINDFQRRSTSSLIFRTIRDCSTAGGIGRSDIIKITGLPPKKVATILSYLVRRNAVQAAGDPSVIRQTMTASEATLAAMLALEEALAKKIVETGVTPEKERMFARYQKCKTLALRPGTDAEGDIAMMHATVALVKLVWS